MIYHQPGARPGRESVPPRSVPAPGSATIDDFLRLDLRVGRVVAARAFPEARKPAYQLAIDFGPGGIRRSSAQLPGTYPDPAVLVGRLVVVRGQLRRPGASPAS